MGAGESREERNAGESREESKATTALAVGASVGLAAGAIYALLASGSEKEENMMKAPGKKGATMPRDDFIRDPKGYFSDPHKGKGKGNSDSDGDGDEIAKGPWMKAPGKIGVRIRRDDFEDNPKAYFSDLRKGK